MALESIDYQDFGSRYRLLQAIAKVAEVKGNKLKVWEYEGMIKHHVEECPSCCKFLERISEKSKISDADSSRSPIDVLARLSSPVRILKKEGCFERGE